MRKSRIIKKYVSMLVLTVWISLIAGISVVTYPTEATRLLNNDSYSAAIAQDAAPASSEEETESAVPALINNPNANTSKWTFMVYINADDNLEGAAICDFIEMANIGSSEDINIVVQIDRIPEYDDSYDDWTDCRRFLITQGLTPKNGSEVMNIGEVNMGDPATLVSFVEWAAYNYSAEKYALIISSHGKGWAGCCWDETSGNDNMMDLTEMRGALGDISGFMGQPLDIIGFDACLMGMTEVAYELREYASIMVASEHAEPSSGWPYNAILAQLVATPEADAAQLAAIIVDNYYNTYAPTGYTMAAVDLTEIDAVVGSLDDLAQALVVYDGTDTQTVKKYAESAMTALDEAIIYEMHGTRWPDSHGLAIYFPKDQGAFDATYNADTVSLADDTAWEEFLIGYFTYAGDDWVTTARDETMQYYCKEHIDLYDFCQNLIDDET